jgi:large subunit ribosomal protein L21
MYAVFRDGSHQVRAAVGDDVEVARREVAPGEELVFDQVLMIGGEKPRMGSPVLPGARVVAVVVGQSRGPKVRGMRKRENNNSQTRFGHRQEFTTATIKEIVTG